MESIKKYFYNMRISKLFDKNTEIVRLGLTTWSGNKRMMKLAEKLGLKKEATSRKARIINNKYYDSVSYGILCEEWEVIKEIKWSSQF